MFEEHVKSDQDDWVRSENVRCVFFVRETMINILYEK